MSDVLLGALDAHLHLRGLGAASEHRKGFTMSLRIGGYAAIVGGVLIGLVIFLTGGLTEGSKDAAAIALLVGLAALLVGLAGMSAFQARSDPWLVWGAFAMTAVGTVVTFVASVSDLAGAGPGDWRDGLLPIGLLTAGLGSTLFGVATYRVSVLSRTGALALAMLIGAVPSAGPGARFLALVGMVSFLASWVTLGVAIG
jgi:hypothetical protein